MRNGIGNGGTDCQISYMQAKKYPNATEQVLAVPGVSNKNLLKNPYNTLNEPIAQPGQRPLRITTDNRGNVFARSETMMVPGVTNMNLLKNPFNVWSEPVPEKRVLSLQRIKDINSGVLPSFVTENKGINEVMLQILMMISDKPVKLITIQLLKILITKNGKTYKEQSQQKILSALQYFDSVLTEGRKVFKENTLSPTRIPEMLQPAVDLYVSQIKRLYPGLKESASTDTDIQTGLTELGLMSNVLTRMFENNNAIDPSNTLTRDQIMSASMSGSVAPLVVGQPPPPDGGVAPPQPDGGVAPPQPDGGVADGGPPQQVAQPGGVSNRIQRAGNTTIQDVGRAVNALTPQRLDAFLADPEVDKIYKYIAFNRNYFPNLFSLLGILTQFKNADTRSKVDDSKTVLLNNINNNATQDALANEMSQIEQLFNLAVNSTFATSIGTFFFRQRGSGRSRKVMLGSGASRKPRKPRKPRKV
jgi:hypothetical protein